VLLTSSEARALAALNRLEEVHSALARATDARDRVQPDELDVLGGICNFSRPPQLHYAAEALSWGGASEASHVERFALEALDAYAAAPQGRSIRNEANTRCALAVARVARGEVDGAAEALLPVLELASPLRSDTIATSVERVRTALNALQAPGRDAIELAGAIEGWSAARLTQAR
jgi:hypothetical protein